MASKVRSYLRTYRKRSGLTQDEVAYLLGCQSGAKISRFERLAREPNLETALACQVIFGVPAEKLYPGMFAEVEQAVTERARSLAKRLQGDTNPDARHAQKMALLKSILAASASEPANNT